MIGLNEKEFLDLVTKHQGILHKVCRMFAQDEQDQRDLFQEITIKLLLGYKTYKGEAVITTWMYRVALNTAITIQRKEKRQTQMQPLHPNIQPPVPEVTGITQVEVDLLYQAINRLNPVDKAIIMLYLDEKKYDEIGENIGITRTHVGVKITRIKKKLEAIMKPLVEV